MSISTPFVTTRRIRPRVPTAATPASLNDAAATTSVLAVATKSMDWFRSSPHRVRKPGKRQLRKIIDSLNQFGMCRPLLVTKDGEIIDGHAVFEACKERGMTDLPAIIIDHLTPAQIRSLRLALNKTPEFGLWNDAALKVELEFLFEVDPELTFFTGFDTAEIDSILGLAGNAPVPRPEPEVVSRLGDLWICGDHAILCGSASDPQSYETLLDGERAQLLFTDPPYGCPIKGHVSKSHGEFVEGSGLNDDELNAFFDQFLEASKPRLAPGALVYMFIDAPGMLSLLQASRRQSFEQKTICVWDKQSGGMGSLYRSQAEYIVVAKSGIAPHINNIQLGKFGRTRTTVWSYPGLAQFGPERDTALAMHPTVKPVGLVADAILDASHRKGLVLDPFLGSGTTLVAAQRTGRRGRGIELDPKFVDVAVRRLEEAVGQAAVHATSKRTFNEVKEERLGGDQTAPASVKIKA